MNQIKKLLNDARESFERGDLSSEVDYKSKLWALNEAWNKKSNDLWDEVKKEEPDEENNDPYFWIKEDKRQRQKVRELRKVKFEERRDFYLDLFSYFFSRSRRASSMRSLNGRSRSIASFLASFWRSFSMLVVIFLRAMPIIKIFIYSNQ